ncbi:hypothetical protein HMPREF0063_10201 [Aeromicrobium marinum DSM 15272]|uniref:Uncharacterized protein n=1 Tax=Aeromicrobium marinum DSM 15272 TaxID=585531 RepID=E2S844_9ACTN|nr:hypothetical protein [Aeromicrobium marinum]EFQ84349.1 hypothetical protein HMPREF0063_10201 [Aeromicrobium marinum DSM 15272]
MHSDSPAELRRRTALYAACLGKTPGTHPETEGVVIGFSEFLQWFHTRPLGHMLRATNAADQAGERPTNIIGGLARADSPWVAALVNAMFDLHATAELRAAGLLDEDGRIIDLNARFAGWCAS